MRSPIDPSSPDKSTIAVDTASIADQSKPEAVQSPSGIERKTSTASRKDHHGSKETSSVSGSRGKRRGTHDHIDTSGAGSAVNSNRKDKTSKDREKSKNGTKSAKKVVIDDDVATTIAGIVNEFVKTAIYFLYHFVAFYVL